MTLRRWASSRGEDLATGRAADAIVAHVTASGGVLSADDLARYTVERRAPVQVSFHGFTVLTMPPPSSGGIALAQMLRVLEGYDLASMKRDSPEYLHLLAEVMKQYGLDH